MVLHIVRYPFWNTKNSLRIFKKAARTPKIDEHLAPMQINLMR